MRTTITGKLLYLVMDAIADEDGVVVISHRKIGNTLGISRSAVSRNLHRLEDEGAVTIMPRFNEDGGRSANKYIVW